MDGDVYDQRGNRLGRSRDIVQEFLDEVVKVRDVDGSCYVACSDLLPAEFVERLTELDVPVVCDSRVARGRAVIVAGEPPS